MLDVIAETGERFAGFFPYVASINDEGAVAFQASMTGGGTGVFVGDCRQIGRIPGTGSVRKVVSHPDVNRSGDACFYAELGGGVRGVVLARDGRVVSIADTRGSFEDIGPLGPTMNEAGAVAFRGTVEGAAGIFSGSLEGTTTIADTTGPFEGFDGLPVINASGAVVFRVNLKEGGQAICLRHDASLTTVADTREDFDELGRFPVLDDSGRVAFCATLEGRPGIFAVRNGEIERLVDADAPFESYRGVLINDAGDAVFYGTPGGGQIGIFVGPDPVEDRLFGLGDPLGGSTVTGFVLNPVSMNEAKQLAIRVELADGRQLIVRVHL